MKRSPDERYTLKSTQKMMRHFDKCLQTFTLSWLTKISVSVEMFHHFPRVSFIRKPLHFSDKGHPLLFLFLSVVFHHVEIEGTEVNIWKGIKIWIFILIWMFFCVTASSLFTYGKISSFYICNISYISYIAVSLCEPTYLCWHVILFWSLDYFHIY